MFRACGLLSRSVALRSALTTTARRTCASSTKPIDVLAKAQSHSIRLSETERSLIEKDADSNGDGIVSESEWKALVQSHAQRNSEKMLLIQYIGRVTEDGSNLGQTALRRVGLVGVIFFSITGTYAAAEVGMHVIGSTIVGNLTALGGGTLNGSMMGATPVGWMVNPFPLMVSIAAGIATFYGLPLAVKYYEEASATKAPPPPPPTQVEAAPPRSGRWWGKAEPPAEPPPPPPPAAEKPTISPVRTLMFGMESMALAAFSVVGAQSGITRGLPPFVCACLGVTIAFGGVFRDLLIQKDIALGARNQSYGLASAAGGATYVGLRELHVRYACRFVQGGLPLTLRIATGMGAALAVRCVAWQALVKGEDLLTTSEKNADKNLAWLRKGQVA